MSTKLLNPKLKNVPETMLISLRARYLETKTDNGIINDLKSVEIMEKIDYDFSGKKEVSKGAQIGTSRRTEILDEQTKKFLADYPNSVVVNLGCGIDTRYNRVDNGIVTWFDLDVPESIELIKHFFNETNRFKFISKSYLDFSWIDKIPKDKPTLFIAEGLLMYFTDEQVKSVIKAIVKTFPKAEMLLEAMSPFLVQNLGKHPDLKNFDAIFQWGIKTGKEIESWNIGARFVNEWHYFDRHIDRVPFFYRVLILIPALRKMMKIVHLKF